MVSAVEFRLWAPYNAEAALMGDFLPESSIEMKKDDKGYFRVQIDLEDGCYPYKFKVRSKSFFF